MTDNASRRAQFRNDPLRPQYHFSPPANWMNDPNGLIYWQGRYHLFYQHNPTAPVWGKMHWGHAVSQDLVHWQDRPIALAPTPDSPDQDGCWSGCAVDHDGVATIFYTGVRGENHETQTVCVATSTDADLATWEKYPHNPVLSAPPAEFSGCGFRDPYVWRGRDGEWFMVIGAGKKGGGEAVLLYRSEDLYNWRFWTPLLVNDAHNDYVYECPNFFRLGDDDKFVLIVSVMPTSHVEYFVGLWWGNNFIVEHHGRLGTAPLYAPLSFKDAAGRRLLMGWLRETCPADVAHSMDWSGVMSLPMELTLPDEKHLALTPLETILHDSLPEQYWQFQQVTAADLPRLQQQVGSMHLKVVIAADVSKVIFIDGSVVEYFNFPDYVVRRVYGDQQGLAVLADLVPMPITRMGVWRMPSIWR